ncbi:MAG: porin [Bdellovibrionota bacterium]
MNREGNRDIKNRWRTGAALAALGFAALTGTAMEARADAMTADWKEGVTISTENKDAKISFGGRVLFDMYFAKAGQHTEATSGVAGVPPLGDEVRFRELRLQTEGVLWDNTEFKIQIDFADTAKIAIKDTYVGIKDMGGGFGLRIGHFKEPFSLEELTSGRFVTFTARALPTGAFAPSRNMGFMIHNEKLMEGKASICAGIFRDTNDSGQFSDDDDLAYNLTGRLTFAPVLENKGEQLVHVGFAYTHREPKGDQTDRANVVIKAKPELAYLSDNTFNTQTDAVDRDQRMGFEAAAQFASISIQGEYYLAFLTIPGSDRRYNGWYGQASFFPTGEFRPYSPGGFKRVKPKSNVFQGGTGAIELAIRYSNLNLIDDGNNAGAVALANNGKKGNALAAAVNWYLNPNVAFKLNYIFADLEDAENPINSTRTALSNGSVHAIVFRAQADI